MVSTFHAHLISGTINLVATILTAIALFSCHWLKVGLLHFGLASTCTYHAVMNSPGWIKVSLIFIIIAFILQLIGVLLLLGTRAFWRFNNYLLKIDVVLTALSLACLLVCVLVFGISVEKTFYSTASLGYSYILACIALGISLFACLPAVYACIKTRDGGDSDYWLDHVRNFAYYYDNVGLISSCTPHFISNGSWVTTTLAFIIIAFVFQIIGILHLLGTSAYRKFNNHILKVDTTLTTLSLLCLLIAIIVFGVSSADDFPSSTFGYSYIMACVAAGISLFAYLPAAHAWNKIKRCGDCECEVFEW